MKYLNQRRIEGFDHVDRRVAGVEVKNYRSLLPDLSIRFATISAARSSVGTLQSVCPRNSKASETLCAAEMSQSSFRL
jgi:hypothetical protein